MDFIPQVNLVCAACGGFVNYLVDYTGWCRSCSPPGFCDTCGTSLTDAQIVNRRRHCNTCQQENWFIRHGDELDSYLSTGITLEVAVYKVRHYNRPHCLSCGDFLSHASERTLFCTRHERCRQVRRRFKYFRYELKLDKNESIEKAMAITNESSTSTQTA